MSTGTGDQVTTLNHVVERWLEHVGQRMDLSSATIVMYRRIATHILAWGRDKPVARLDLGPYALRRRDAGLTARTLALELRVIQVAFRWAQTRHLIATNLTLSCLASRWTRGGSS